MTLTELIARLQAFVVEHPEAADAPVCGEERETEDGFGLEGGVEVDMVIFSAGSGKVYLI